MSARTSPPAHGVAASDPELLDPALVAVEVERLRARVRECAQYLLENDWRAAARAAYTAAWSYHRLPRAEQAAFVISDLHEDDGPMPVDDDWSASAFAVWLVYRINRTMPPGHAYTPRAASHDAPESSDARPTIDAPALPELNQAAMFDAPVKTNNVRGKL